MVLNSQNIFEVNFFLITELDSPRDTKIARIDCDKNNGWTLVNKVPDKIVTKSEISDKYIPIDGSINGAMYEGKDSIEGNLYLFQETNYFRCLFNESKVSIFTNGICKVIFK